MNGTAAARVRARTARGFASGRVAVPLPVSVVQRRMVAAERQVSELLAERAAWAAERDVLKARIVLLKAGLS